MGATRVPAVVAVTCPHPHKAAYSSRREAVAVLARIPRDRKVGAHPYRCLPGCGAWHLGRRIRRPLVAWRSTP